MKNDDHEIRRKVYVLFNTKAPNNIDILDQIYQKRKQKYLLLLG